MQINVQVSVLPNETLTKSASQIASEILTAVGGDPELDTVTVTTSASAGASANMPAPGLITPTPPPPRTI